MQHLIHILFVLFASLVITLPMSAKEQYVDPVFGDTIDRSAEDFVKVSLVIADPGALFSSVLGHACLRMQCPVFGLDACYSYESMLVGRVAICPLPIWLRRRRLLLHLA